MSQRSDEQGTPIPDGDDENSLQEYGRQLAMDQLLHLLDHDPSEVQQTVDNSSSSQWHSKKLVGVFLGGGLVMGAVCVLIFFGLATSKPQLDSKWEIYPKDGSEFQVLGSTHIRLIHGELEIVNQSAGIQTVPLKVDSLRSTIIVHHGHCINR